MYVPGDRAIPASQGRRTRESTPERVAAARWPPHVQKPPRAIVDRGGLRFEADPSQPLSINPKNPSPKPAPPGRCAHCSRRAAAQQSATILVGCRRCRRKLATSASATDATTGSDTTRFGYHDLGVWRPPPPPSVPFYRIETKRICPTPLSSSCCCLRRATSGRRAPDDEMWGGGHAGVG